MEQQMKGNSDILQFFVTFTEYGWLSEKQKTLVWEIAARGELARLTGQHFTAAYIYCSKCYERVNHKVAATAAVKTGCNSTIVSLSFAMYKTPR
eukprot:8619684-Heterocapsa_arctica.AAC.1